ncbi:MAG: hypothetical protein Q7V19_08105 [Bacteroidales bacterium]|nr:hypothetical protein [Bacteroidales bacterium]MDP2196829.1 hypothetical protein [Rhodocyclaceae bacterium]
MYRSYPGNASMAGGVPAYVQPQIAVDLDWVRLHGSRAQRRRIEKSLKRQATKVQIAGGKAGRDE